MNICTFDPCDRVVYATGHCSRHYKQKRQGKELTPIRFKAEKGNARSITKDGYIVISKPGHPNAWSNGYTILEHVYMMSEHLGRALLPNENVHHKNGERDDNRLENLELWVISQPAGQRLEDKAQWVKEFIATYGKQFGFVDLDL